MEKNIFSITGFSCAGKSTLIKQLIDNLGTTTIRYGDIHREAIRRANYKLGADWIEAEGFDAYEEGALEVFKEEISKQDAENLIVDGLFSNRCFQYLKGLPGIKVTNILLATTYEDRIRRMAKREKIDMQDAEGKLERVDWLKYFAGLNNIQENADFIINGRERKEEITQKVMKIMKEVIQGDFEIGER